MWTIKQDGVVTLWTESETHALEYAVDLAARSPAGSIVEIHDETMGVTTRLPGRKAPGPAAAGPEKSPRERLIGLVTQAEDCADSVGNPHAALILGALHLALIHGSEVDLAEAFSEPMAGVLAAPGEIPTSN